MLQSKPLGILFCFGTCVFALYGIIYLLQSSYTLIVSSINGHITFVEGILNVIVLLYEIFLLPLGIFLLVHLSAAILPHNGWDDLPELKEYPKVTILIPTANPNLSALKKNFLRMKDITYPHWELIVVDNSLDKFHVSKIEQLCREFSVIFLHRDNKKGFKAGNINFALPKVTGKYILFIDIDQSIRPVGIKKLVTILEAHPEIAFVQAKYQIKNANSIIRIATAILYSYYYEVLAFGKDLWGRVLFNGTTACFRLDAINAVGGFPEDTYTEDIDISFKLIIAGYKTRFLNEVVTTALVPWRLQDLIASMWRWTHGTIHITMIRTKEIIKSKKISLAAKVELLLNTSVWLGGAGIVVAAICFLFLYWGKWRLFRPEYLFTVFNESIKIQGQLVFPLIFVFITFIGSLMGILSTKSYKWLFFLIPYGIASISLFYFLIAPIIYAFIGLNGPNAMNSEWILALHYRKIGCILIPLGIIYLITAAISFQQNNPQWVFFLTISISMISPFLFLIKDKFINIEKLEYEYFDKSLELEEP